MSQKTHGEVVPKQLHYESAVLVGVFVQRIQLGYRLIKSLQSVKSVLSRQSHKNGNETTFQHIWHLTEFNH